MASALEKIIPVLAFCSGIVLWSQNAGFAQEVIVEDSTTASTQYEVIEEHPAQAAPLPQVTTLQPSQTNQTGRKPKGGLVITGSVLFGVSYGISLWCVMLGAPTTMAIPVAGPAVTFIGEMGVPGDIVPFAVLWSAAQGIGLGLLIWGLVGEPVQTASNNHLHIEPMVSSHGMGLKLRLAL